MRQTASSPRSIDGSCCRGAANSPCLNASNHLEDIVAPERRPAGQQAIEGGAQRVDVAARPEAVEVAESLLGAHIRRSAQGASRQCLGTAAGRARDQRPLTRIAARLDPTQRLGEPPVDDQRLAVLAHDDVARLDIPMQDAAAVGVVDRVADVGEPPQQLAQFQRPAAGVGLERFVRVEPLDGILEAIAADEPHGVVRPAVAVAAQAVDRDDARMLQPAGDLGLEQESAPAFLVIGM